jgi:hypothetical protein
LLLVILHVLSSPLSLAGVSLPPPRKYLASLACVQRSCLPTRIVPPSRTMMSRAVFSETRKTSARSRGVKSGCIGVGDFDFGLLT